MTAAPTDGPQWHDGVPDRTRDPAIKRLAIHRMAIAFVKRVTRGRSYKFMLVLSVNRRLFRPFIGYNMRLMPYGTLPRIETEAVILRTAALCGSRYEWAQHVEIGSGAGLTAEQIALIERDPANPQLGERMLLLMRATAELLDNRILTDETWDELRRHYAPAQVLEVIMLVGNYAMLAGALNTFGVRTEKALER